MMAKAVPKKAAKKPREPRSSQGMPEPERMRSPGAAGLGWREGNWVFWGMGWLCAKRHFFEHRPPPQPSPGRTGGGGRKRVVKSSGLARFYPVTVGFTSSVRRLMVGI
jgi:hypothetical protein